MATKLTAPEPPARYFVPLKPKSTTGDKLVGTVSHAMLIMWSAIVILPLVWTIMTSFKTTTEIFASPLSLPLNWDFDNYITAWTTAGIGSYFLNTLLVVASALVIV